MTPIGRRDARITIERATESVDAQGSVTQTWATLATVWAHAQTMSGKESTNGSARDASAEQVFSVRYQSALDDLNPRDRISWNGFIYDITSALPLPPSRPAEVIISAVFTNNAINATGYAFTSDTTDFTADMTLHTADHT
jgi:SPP1 family predicted phage head-tail adaptor